MRKKRRKSNNNEITFPYILEEDVLRYIEDQLALSSPPRVSKEKIIESFQNSSRFLNRLDRLRIPKGQRPLKIHEKKIEQIIDTLELKGKISISHRTPPGSRYYDRVTFIEPFKGTKRKVSTKPTPKADTSWTKIKEFISIHNRKVIFVSVLIVAILIGSLLNLFLFSRPIIVEKYNEVTLDYTVWVSDEDQNYDVHNPVFEEIIQVEVVSIVEDNYYGLILGLYNNLLGKPLNYESEVIWLNKCIDQNLDGIDDNTGLPALSYGRSDMYYYNTCLMIHFVILEIMK